MVTARPIVSRNHVAGTSLTNMSVSAAEATRVVLAVLAAKTGYEPDMIEMDMALETELGVDSIKRVEILSDVQKELNVEAQDVAALARTQTVGEVVEAMIAELRASGGGGGGGGSAAPMAAAPASSGGGGGGGGGGGSGVSNEEATRVVLAVLAAKTGYEPDMIEMDMALETELGVDSIKRVEILSDVQKELNVEAQDVAALARTQTVGEVVEAMIKELGGAAPAGGAAAPVAARVPVAASTQQAQARPLPCPAQRHLPPRPRRTHPHPPTPSTGPSLPRTIWYRRAAHRRRSSQLPTPRLLSRHRRSRHSRRRSARRRPPRNRPPPPRHPTGAWRSSATRASCPAART